ncbi:MAG: aldo/keto reductase [Bacteroidetes bacterium]|nr:aldo/keto reductase [Bacteroidota bacterium]
MKYRKLGKTNFEVSEVGYGTWGMGGNMWLDGTDDESVKSLHRAFDLGVNFVDTALAYGNGHSEELIGKVLKERKERIYVATKVPPLNNRWPAPKGVPFHEAFTYDHIIKSTEKSLRNLKMDCVDVQQFHVWQDEWAKEAEWQDAIMKLKSEGKVRFFGISINDHQPENGIEAARTGLIDAFQVIYNIFDQSPEDKLFSFCLQNNVGIIVRVPFDEGALTGKITPESTFPEGDFRNRYFGGDRKKEVVKHVEPLLKLLDGEANTLPELALRFVLHHPAVSTIIPGMRKVPHVETNCAVSDGKRLSDKLLAELKKHRWDKDYYSVR